MKVELVVIETNKNRHVSVDTIEEFETAILSDETTRKASVFPQKYFRFLLLIDKIGKKFNLYFLNRKKKGIKKSTDTNNHLFTIMMNIDYFKLFPYIICSSKSRNVFMFDAWPNTHQQISDFISDYKIDRLFVSSYQAANTLNKQINRNNVYWIPEGINPAEYEYLSFEEKDIDILSIGRKYDLYHEKIRSYFDSSDKVYLYEKEKGQIIFPDRKDFIRGLARSKISICIPSNITHPDRAGDIETMTIRYLQSIVSKCLIVGYAPKEMIDLFGYNPVIEIDLDNPVDQLNKILDNYSEYIPLIEKNYECVINNHTWAHRWDLIKNILKTQD